MPDRAVVDDDDDIRCPHTRKDRDQTIAAYETFQTTGNKERMEAAQREYEFCLKNGWELEPQTPWQTWGAGWEKVYG